MFVTAILVCRIFGSNSLLICHQSTNLWIFETEYFFNMYLDIHGGFSNLIHWNNHNQNCKKTIGISKSAGNVRKVMVMFNCWISKIKFRIICTGCLIVKYAKYWVALRGRGINHWIELWCPVASGDSEICVSSANFQKNDISWPKQPPTEKVPKFNMIFHDSTKKLVILRLQI